MTSESQGGVHATLAILLDEQQHPELRSDAADELATSKEYPEVMDALLIALTYRGPPRVWGSTPATAALTVWGEDVGLIIRRLRSRLRWRGAIKSTLKQLADTGFWASIFSIDPFSPEPSAVDLVVSYQDAVASITDRGSAIALANELETLDQADTFRGLSWMVRSSAAASLATLGGTSVTDVLIDALTDEHETVRESAAAAVGSLGGERAVSALIRALEDEEPGVRHSAAEALGQIGDKRAIGPLKKAVRLRRFDYPPSFGKFAELFPDRGRGSRF